MSLTLASMQIPFLQALQVNRNLFGQANLLHPISLGECIVRIGQVRLFFKPDKDSRIMMESNRHPAVYMGVRKSSIMYGNQPHTTQRTFTISCSHREE